MASTESPVTIRYYKSGERKNRVEIESNETGRVLAWCYIGDDLHVERIADILSMKRLPREAAALRKLAQDARRPIRNCI